MIKDIDSSSQPIEQESKIIYEYLLRSATQQLPQEVVRELTNLFVQGRNDNAKVSKALETIIFATVSKQDIYIFFSNCFYLILDCWLIDPESLSYVSQLLNILEIVGQVKSYDRRRKQLVKLLTDYQISKSYLKLKAVVAIINSQEIAQVATANSIATNEVSYSKSKVDRDVNTYIARYTYLYQHFTPSDSRFERLDKLIESLQTSRQQDFEFKLSRHIIYRFRLKQIARMKLLTKGAGKIITKVDNPSLLSEKAFRIALQQYIGKIDSAQTLQEQSQRFVVDNRDRNSYQVFKQDLHRFLCKNIKPRNNDYNFAQKLEDKLKQIFPNSENKPLNDTLILQTSRQLFSYLIVDTATPTDTQRFADLVINLGTAQVMIILIKIALICPESKPDLEKKIALIVSYYQMYKIQDVPWVVKTLEHLLIAFGIYFGKMDVSIAKSAIA